MTLGKTAIANGELISQTRKPPSPELPGGEIHLDTLNHENMHQWWGDIVSSLLLPTRTLPRLGAGARCQR